MSIFTDLSAIAKSVSSIAIYLKSMALDIADIKQSNLQILAVLRLRQPEPVSIRVLTPREEMKVLVYPFVLGLPVRGTVDVQRRELTVSIGGKPLDNPIEVQGTINESPELTGKINDVVEGQLVDIDAAGNRSVPRPFTFTITDDTAPPEPGELGIKISDPREIDVEDPVTPTDPTDPSTPSDPSTPTDPVNPDAPTS